MIDSIDDYEQTLAGVFDFDAIRSYTTRADVKFKFDSLHGVTGPYARHIFTHLLGVPESAISHGDTLPDFGGLHPDPNLTYAEELVHHMYSGEYDFGGAWDGDGVCTSSNLVATAQSSSFVIRHCIDDPRQQVLRDAVGLGCHHCRVRQVGHSLLCRWRYGRRSLDANECRSRSVRLVCFRGVALT